jgi:3-deoxy-manno-octulosonate cytidylyltransferase (CMP-KDO synthetase)
VALDSSGYAMYFSRSRIPYPRNAQYASYYKHIGIYMYSRETLSRICAWPPTDIERAESLEQLRALSNGVRILTVECEYDSIAVDVPEDITRVLERLSQESSS